MYMIDTEEQKHTSFGYTNKDGYTEAVSFHDGLIDFIDSDHEANMCIYPEDVPKMIKALKHMHKYLVDEKLI